MPRNSKDGSYYRFNEMETIAKVYFLRSKYFKNNLQKPVIETNKKARKINKITKAFSALSDPYKTIIRNTFFEKKDEFWWSDYYPKTTYYRMRNQAIKAFLLAYKLQ